MALYGVSGSPSVDWWVKLWSACFCSSLFSFAHVESSLNFDMALCVHLFWTAPMPFSLHSMMVAGSLRSSGAMNTCPIPSLCLSMEAMCTGRTGGRILWQEPISGLGKMSQSSRRRVLSLLTCRSSTPAGSHKVRTVFLASLYMRRDTHRKETINLFVGMLSLYILSVYLKVVCYLLPCHTVLYIVVYIYIAWKHKTS